MSRNNTVTGFSPRVFTFLGCCGVILVLCAGVLFKFFCQANCEMTRSKGGDLIIADDYILAVVNRETIARMFGAEYSSGQYYYRCNKAKLDDGTLALVSMNFRPASRPPIIRTTGTEWDTVDCTLLDLSARKMSGVTIDLRTRKVHAWQWVESIEDREVTVLDNGDVTLW